MRLVLLVTELLAPIIIVALSFHHLNIPNQILTALP
jgi:hypothetical protein